MNGLGTWMWWTCSFPVFSATRKKYHGNFAIAKETFFSHLILDGSVRALTNFPCCHASSPRLKSGSEKGLNFQWQPRSVWHKIHQYAHWPIHLCPISIHRVWKKNGWDWGVIFRKLTRPQFQKKMDKIVVKSHTVCSGNKTQQFVWSYWAIFSLKANSWFSREAWIWFDFDFSNIKRDLCWDTIMLEQMIWQSSFSPLWEFDDLLCSLFFVFQLFTLQPCGMFGR